MLEKHQNRLYLIGFNLCLLAWLIGLIVAYVFIENSVMIRGESQDLESLRSFFPIQNKRIGFIEILIRNLIVGFVALFGGCLSFGILPILIFIWNGFVVGMLFCWDVKTKTTYELMNLYGYHGVLEITGLCMLGALGFYGFVLFKNYTFNLRAIEPRMIFSKLCYAIILLIIASIIETI